MCIFQCNDAFVVFLQAYEARIKTCVAISEELDREEYHDVQRILVKLVRFSSKILYSNSI